jgi:hypothetical protein
LAEKEKAPLEANLLPAGQRAASPHLQEDANHKAKSLSTEKFVLWWSRRYLQGQINQSSVLGGVFMSSFPQVEPHHLKATLKESRVSQFVAARSLGISQSALSQYLLGYRPFPPELERKLAGLIEDAGQNTEATG